MILPQIPIHDLLYPPPLIPIGMLLMTAGIKLLPNLKLSFKNSQVSPKIGIRLFLGMSILIAGYGSLIVGLEKGKDLLLSLLGLTP